MCIRSLAGVAIVFALAAATIFSGSPLKAGSGLDPGSLRGQTQAHKPAWLEGSGDDLRMKIAGQVLDQSGAPANGCKLQAHLKMGLRARDLPVTAKGNRFEIWVPVGMLWRGLRFN